MTPELQGIYKLASLITIVLFAYILTFMVKLERTGCECALDWRRHYIIFYSVYSIIIALASFTDNVQLLAALSPVTLALGLLFIVFTLQYVHRLKREKCSCSDTMGRVILYIVAAIDAAVFAVAGLIIIMNAILLLINNERR